MTEILPPRQYQAGIHRAQAVSVPQGANAARLTVPRDQWTEREGDKRSEIIDFEDPDDKSQIERVSGNVDEVARVWVMASTDQGSQWRLAGMIGTLGGPLGQRRIGGTLAKPILGQGFETAIRIAELEGAQLRIFLECLVGIRARLDIEFLSIERSTLTPRRNSVGFVAANSAQATSATSLSSGNVTPSGSNRMVVAFSSELDNGGAGAHTLTYAGGSPDEELYNFLDSGFGQVARLAAGRFMAPATSANQASVTSDNNADNLYCGVIAFDGVDQTTPVGAEETTETSSASISVDVGSVAVDDMVCDHVIAGGTPISVNQSNTSRWEEEISGGDSSGASTKTGSGTVTIGWSTGGNGAMLAGFRIIASAASASLIGHKLGTMPYRHSLVR